jgi:hypothetical protein
VPWLRLLVAGLSPQLSTVVIEFGIFGGQSDTWTGFSVELFDFALSV